MIEYRKANGLKDKTNPYGDDCLIIHRVTNNYWSNVEVENQGRTGKKTHRLHGKIHCLYSKKAAG